MEALNSEMNELSKKLSEIRIKKAMKHPNVLGAGAKKRKHLSPRERASAVMKEGYRGTLHSGSGDIVTKLSQMKAIAMSESGLSKKKKKGTY